MIQNDELTGKILIALPDHNFGTFKKSVIYVCAQSEQGTMGVVVNRPASNTTVPDLLQHMQLDVSEQAKKTNLCLGGPVEQGRGLVIHSDDYTDPHDSIHVSDHVFMTPTLGVLEQISEGYGPESAMISMGYTGWAPGQLESEIAQNNWLVGKAWDDVIFGNAHEFKWKAALSTLGAKSESVVSLQVGHA